MYDRYIEPKMQSALENSPVVLITGPRHAGKTTLVRKMESKKRRYITFDDATTYDAVQLDPVGFLRGTGPIIIDEVQRIPELFLPIKRMIDEDRKNGQFLLTGSVNVLHLPRLGNSLVGRMQTHNLLPLSRAEIAFNSPIFLEGLFGGQLTNNENPIIGDELIHTVLMGGFPVNIDSDEKQREIWADDYTNIFMERDLRDIAELEKVPNLPLLIKNITAYAGHLVNYSRLSTNFGVSVPTMQSYIKWLERLYLISVVQPWYSNALNRVSKTPKLHFIDAGLLAVMNNVNFAGIKRDPNKFGPILESFVLSEILKLINGSSMRIIPHHFRINELVEVDFVLARNDGLIAGIEVKSAAIVSSKDFNGLRKLKSVTKDDFVMGVVLYDGTDIIPFGDRLFAAPISTLWS